MIKRTFAEEFLIEGLRDYLSMSWAASVVTPEDDSTLFEDNRAAAVGMVTLLLLEGKIEAIERVNGGWKRREEDPGQIAIEMARRWLEEWPNENPTPGALGWLRNTPLGDDTARASEARGE